MVLIKTEVKFEAAHRQFGDPSKCGYLHGHNWVVEFVVRGEVTSELGYLINYSDFKAIVDRYDHKVLLVNYDPLIDVLLTHHQRVVALSLNPTCENLAKLILQDILATHNDVDLEYISITVWENDVSMAVEQWSHENQ